MILFPKRNYDKRDDARIISQKIKVGKVGRWQLKFAGCHKIYRFFLSEGFPYDFAYKAAHLSQLKIMIITSLASESTANFNSPLTFPTPTIVEATNE